MELHRQRNQYDPENGCRSLGSEFLPSGQSRKVSIGIMADAPGKSRTGAKNEDGVAVKSTKKGASSQKDVKENSKKAELVASLKGKEAGDPCQKTSPWISTKSFTAKTPTTETVKVYAKRTSTTNSVDADGAHKRFNRINVTPNSEVVQLYARQSSIFQSGSGVQKRFDGVAYGMSKEMEGDKETVKEFAFAAQAVHFSDKGAGEENKENRLNQNNESLRQRLWEALETAASQKEKDSDSTAFEEGTENPKLNKQCNHTSNKAARPKQNSDTIETDSESPVVSTKRPVTRSLTRKKASTTPDPKSREKISDGGNLLSSTDRGEHQEKNIFTFNEAEDQSGNLYWTANASLPKKTEKINRKVDPRRLFSSGKKKPEKIKQGAGRGDRVLGTNKTPSHSSRVEKSRSDPSENNKEILQSTNGNGKEEHSHSSKSKKEKHPKEDSSPELSKSVSTQEDLCSGSSQKTVSPQYGDSPTFRIKTTFKDSFLNPPSPKSIQKEHGIQSPAPDEGRSKTEGFYNLRTRQKTKRGSSGINAQTDSSDDTQDLKESPIREASPVLEEIDATHKSSQSSEDQEEESLEEDRPVTKGCRSTRTETAVSHNPEKSPLIILPRKRLRGDGLSSFLPSQKGNNAINELLQHSSQSQEDGLMRAVAVFAMALERFKTRVHTHTSKKSSQILSTLAEEVQSQLQNVNSQIQRDVSKFTNHGKLKRKSFETRFQDQQEKLKAIQEKFRKEVAQHEQECRSLFEDVEACQIELKRDAKKQKVLHQKLLSQVEKSIQNQLEDADRRITAIQKVARNNMFQLRNVITECVKGGVFN
ncbi:hypothetical protein ACHQM5_010232 [Ranunculus cassubicifolius]